MGDYFRTTRTPWHSFVLVLPLLVLYQVTAVFANLGQRRAIVNGADALVQDLLNLFGLHGWVASWLVVALIAGVFIYRTDAAGRASPVRPGHFVLVLAESSVYAVIFGSFVAYLTSLILPGGGFLQMGGGAANFGQKLAVSLGAGFYEELVFRLFLTGGILALLHRARMKRGPAVLLAVVVSSFIFSLFHYIGPLGEPLQIGSFAFRFVAGGVLAGLFALRGFAVAAWTHSLYDVFLLLSGHG
jgi:hypothetical protein